MAQVIEQNDPWSGIGSSFGKGFGDQLPKSYDKAKLSQSLSNINLKGKTPMQAAAELYNATYDRPDIAQALMPFVTQQIDRQNYIDQNKQDGQQAQPSVYGQGSEQPIATGQPTSSQVPAAGTSNELQRPPQQDEAPKLKRLVTPEGEQALRKPLMPLSEQDLRARSVQRLQRNPMLSPQQAYEQEKAEDANRLDRERAVREEAVSQSTLFTNLKNQFDDLVSEKTQRESKDFQAFSGKLKQKFQDQAENDVANGMDTRTAASKYADKLLTVANAHANLVNAGSSWPFSESSKKLNLQNFNRIREKYVEAGALDEYYQNLRSELGFSPQYASYLAYPPSSGVKSEVSSMKPLRGFATGKTREKFSNELIDNIASKIKPDDRIYSLAIEAQKKGLPIDEFIQDFNKRLNDGTLNLSQPLTPEQREQLETTVSVTPGMNDIFYFSNFGLSDVLKYATLNF